MFFYDRVREELNPADFEDNERIYENCICPECFDISVVTAIEDPQDNIEDWVRISLCCKAEVNDSDIL